MHVAKFIDMKLLKTLGNIAKQLRVSYEIFIMSALNVTSVGTGPGTTYLPFSFFLLFFILVCCFKNCISRLLSFCKLCCTREKHLKGMKEKSFYRMEFRVVG